MPSANHAHMIASTPLHTGQPVGCGGFGCVCKRGGGLGYFTPRPFHVLPHAYCRSASTFISLVVTMARLWRADQPAPFLVQVCHSLRTFGGPDGPPTSAGGSASNVPHGRLPLCCVACSRLRCPSATQPEPVHLRWRVVHPDSVRVVHPDSVVPGIGRAHIMRLMIATLNAIISIRTCFHWTAQ